MKNLDHYLDSCALQLDETDSDADVKEMMALLGSRVMKKAVGRIMAELNGKVHMCASTSPTDTGACVALATIQGHVIGLRRALDIMFELTEPLEKEPTNDE